MHYMSKEQRAARDADFEARMQPRPLWNGQDGPAKRITDSKGNVSYTHHAYVKPKSGTRKLTEAEDNAKGRALRRRQNRRIRSSGIPHAAR